jgi:transcriptional regulator with GAF, ATPase, and Fis domain
METPPDYFGLLTAVAKRMVEPTGQRTALTAVLREFESRLGVRSGTIRMWLPDGNEIIIEAGRLHTNPRYLEAYRKAEVVQSAWDTGRPEVVPQWCEEAGICGGANLADGNAVCTTSFLCVPILLGDERLGVVSLDFPQLSPARLWEHARVVGIIAGWVAYDCLARGIISNRRPAPVTADRRLDPPPSFTRLPAPLNGTGAALPAPAPDDPARAASDAVSLKARVQSMERESITAALAASGGNMSAAARRLGITPRMMRYKLKILKIDNTRSSRRRGNADAS